MLSYALFVNIVHFFLVLFVLFGILADDPMILLLYLVTLLSLKMHWWMNNDICALTLLEKQLTGATNRESFIHRLVSPVYVIKDSQLAIISSLVVNILLIMTLYKFWSRGYTPRFYYDYIMTRLKK